MNGRHEAPRRRRPWGVALVGMLPLFGLLFVIGLGRTGGPSGPPPATTSAPVIVVVPDDTKATSWPQLDLDTRQEREDVKVALALVEELDPDRYTDMRREERSWSIDDWDNAGRDLARTDPDACITEVSTRNILGDAPYVGVPYRYWLASILVHEWRHCRPGGAYSERPSIKAQVSFAMTWPEAYQHRALERAYRDTQRLDDEGMWS